MRFRKGRKVDVLSKEEVPSGARHCAEILCGNGHCYGVKYDWSPGSTGSPLRARVSRKHIRPCPPSVGNSVDCLPGDLVEVLDNISWKIATVLKVMNGNYFLVRLLESSQELRVHKSFLSVRQSWQHDRWVIVGNGSVITEDRKPNNVSTARFYQTSCQLPATVRKAKQCVGDNNLVGCQESNVISSRALKRESPYAASQAKGNSEAGRKFRAIEADGRRQQVVSELPLFMEKVVAVAFPQNLLGEKHMHTSFTNISRFSEMDLGRAQQNGDIGYCSDRGLERNDADDSDCCSVGSCGSTGDSPFRLPFRSLTSPSKEPDSSLSDAESFYGWEYEKEDSHPSKEELAAEIHRFELHAYRCTMEALYASGPLSWEQEELVTNLRLTLNISNDEHLTEIKNLVSA